nr:hypothetical protein GCM10017611_59170 [Rhodococcus wratislaviensis]
MPDGIMEMSVGARVFARRGGRQPCQQLPSFANVTAPAGARRAFTGPGMRRQDGDRADRESVVGWIAMRAEHLEYEGLDFVVGPVDFVHVVRNVAFG